MGNCQANCLSVHMTEAAQEEAEEEMIRVVRTTDNEVFQFPGPVSVQDLLFGHGFQGFAVFPHPPSSSSSSSSIFKKKPQPLPPHTLLKFSHLYYLKPFVSPSLIINHHHNMANHCSNLATQTLIKPLIDFGTHSLINTSDKDLLLGQQQVLMTSAKPSANGIFNAQDKDFAGDNLLARKSQEKLAEDLNAQEEPLNESPFTINAQEVSCNEHAEGLITIIAQDERPVDGLPDGSLTLNAHDRSLNELAEGLIAQEKPSSFDAPIQSPSQIMRVVRKVRFSDEIVVIPSSNELGDSAAPVIPSSNELVDSAAPTCSPMSTGNTIASNEETIRRFGKTIDQFDEKIGYYTASKEELKPYMSKKEMNGVVRLKVVISKKQLTELMSSRGSCDKQSNALMEKMLAPLLSPSHKSDNFHGVSSTSPSTWRPSLDHIPEDHDPFHEFFS